jgi:hypothetical protein
MQKESEAVKKWKVIVITKKKNSTFWSWDWVKVSIIDILKQATLPCTWLLTS